MSDHSGTSGDAIGDRPSHARRWAERWIATEGVVPDPVFAEPWFGENRAGFGMLAGRRTIIEVNIGPHTREIRMGRFGSSRRRAVTIADAATVLDRSVDDTARLFEHIERALRAGLAAYQDTYRALAPVTSSTAPARPVRIAPLVARERSTGPVQPAQRPGSDQLAGGTGPRQPRPRSSGVERAIPPFPTGDERRDDPGRAPRLSL